MDSTIQRGSIANQMVLSRLLRRLSKWSTGKHSNMVRSGINAENKAVRELMSPFALLSVRTQSIEGGATRRGACVTQIAPQRAASKDKWSLLNVASPPTDEHTSACVWRGWSRSYLWDRSVVVTPRWDCSTRPKHISRWGLLKSLGGRGWNTFSSNYKQQARTVNASSAN